MKIKKIYFDLDGVLADFDKGVRELCGVEPRGQGWEEKPEEEALRWEKIREVNHFYDKLDVYPGSKEMFDTLYECYGDACEILSAIPGRERGMDSSFEDKTKWVRRLISEDVVINLVYRDEKKSFCEGEDCILIDDYDKNINEWKALGGTGILFKYPRDVVELISDMENKEEDWGLNTLSEKVMYASALDEKAYKYDVVGFLWGEEMYDCKIHIYPHKLASIPEYTEVYDDLINVGMVFLTKKKDKAVHVIVIRLNEKNGTDIYMSENDINRVWKYLRKSVLLGMRICKEENIEIDIEKPEDILDVSMLEKDGRFPVVDEKTHELKYLRRELSDDEIEAQKRKQSALDNPNNRYFFGKNLFVYHDRNCEEIKAIAPEHFMASETVPAYYFPCKKCQRMMLLRKACDPYVKQIPEVDALLRKAGITNEILEKYVMEKSLCFHIDKDGDFVVKGTEDTWLIKGFEKGKYSLWHNNYVKTAPRERYITSGFHEQKVKGKKLKDMFGYIAMYNFDVHLAGEDRKIEIAEKKERARIKEERRMKNPLYRFFKWLKAKFSEGSCGKNR